MARMRARTAALAVVIAGGMLCEGLVCQPARADVLAFNNTLGNGSEFFAVLELFNTAGAVIVPSGPNVVACSPGGPKHCLTTNGAQGSIVDSNTVPSAPSGAAGGNLTSYTAGEYSGYALADFFLFNLGGVTDQKVASAELFIDSGTITNNLTFTLSSMLQSTIAGLENNTDPPSNTTLYGDLMSGTSYGSFPISAISTPPGSPGTLLTFTFTDATSGGAAALTAINAAIGDGTMGFAGNVLPLGPSAPEPSTWVMMLAGFAGLGYIARRRAAKRRAAAAAG